MPSIFQPVMAGFSCGKAFKEVRDGDVARLLQSGPGPFSSQDADLIIDNRGLIRE
jgi:uncharacterized protein YgiB involved in biofilm formation